MYPKRNEYDQISIEDVLHDIQQESEDNSRVLELRMIFDNRTISASSLLHAAMPAKEDFAAIKRFYEKHKMDVISTSGLLRRMMIPYLQDRPNAYRMAKKQSHLFVWTHNDGFVLNLRSCLVTDEKRRFYNNPKVLLGSLRDGSIFWAGKYKQRRPGEKIADVMEDLRDKFDEESSKGDAADKRKLRAISEEYCDRIREMRKVCATAKMRMSNIHTAVAAADEIESLADAHRCDMLFHADRAYQEEQGMTMKEFSGLAEIDEKAFYAACDSVLKSFLGAFADAPCAQFGDSEFPEGMRYKIVPTDIEMKDNANNSCAIAICVGYYDENGYRDVDPLDALETPGPNVEEDAYNETIYVLEHMVSDVSWWPSEDDMRGVVEDVRAMIESMRARYDAVENMAPGSTGGFSPIAGEDEKTAER